MKIQPCKLNVPNTNKTDRPKMKEAKNKIGIVEGSRERLTEFTEYNINWNRIMETKDETSILRNSSSGPAAIVEVVEPKKNRVQTLRTLNILTHSLYHPEKVQAYLTQHFPNVTDYTGLDTLNQSEFYNQEIEQFIEQSSQNDVVHVIDREPGIKKIAETLNIIEVRNFDEDVEDWKPCGYDDPMRNMVQPHARYLRETNIPIVADSLTVGSPFTYRVSGSPVRLEDTSEDALESEWPEDK